MNAARDVTVLTLLLTAMCCSAGPLVADDAPAEALHGGVHFASSDAHLVAIFDWAKRTALRYVGANTDPVGPWYEAALPGRQAFCVRDVAHQCIGAEILGLGRQNRNMLRRFVDGIAESRDYCSFWEIDRLNRPAPVDYENDDDFWYTLNANFDILDACARLYDWSGDKTYIRGEAFDRFCRLTLNEYVDRWQLQPDRIMARTRTMNLKPSASRFRAARGIPSYDELQGGFAVGSDLIGSICNALRRYAAVLRLRKQPEEARICAARAVAYKDLLDKRWWDERSQTYHGFYTEDGQFRSGGVAGNEFLLWYGVVDDPARIMPALHAIKNTQVEVLSYLPTLCYRYGSDREGYDYLRQLHADTRRDYPEAPFAAIEGIVAGLMGIDSSASEGVIATCPHLPKGLGWAEVTGVPTFAGPIAVRHSSMTETTFTSRASRTVRWRALFQGEYARIRVGGKAVAARHQKDALGGPLSYIDVLIRPNREATARAVAR